MTYDEFFEKVKETFYIPAKHTGRKPHPYRPDGYWAPGDENVFKIEWSTGGASGGNCWNDDQPTHYDGEPEPDWDLDKLFEKVCPNMTFLQHRKVLKEVAKHDSRHEYEYYGNYSDYASVTIKYHDLYDALVYLGIIQND